jgi:hypothetical protein
MHLKPLIVAAVIAGPAQQAAADRQQDVRDLASMYMNSGAHVQAASKTRAGLYADWLSARSVHVRDMARFARIVASEMSAAQDETLRQHVENACFREFSDAAIARAAHLARIDKDPRNFRDPAYRVLMDGGLCYLKLATQPLRRPRASDGVLPDLDMQLLLRVMHVKGVLSYPNPVVRRRVVEEVQELVETRRGMTSDVN